MFSLGGGWPGLRRKAHGGYSRSIRYQLSRIAIAIAAAALDGFLFGFGTAVINGAVDAIRSDFGLDASLTGIAVSCALLGSARGA